MRVLEEERGRSLLTQNCVDVETYFSMQHLRKHKRQTSDIEQFRFDVLIQALAMYGNTATGESIGPCVNVAGRLTRERAMAEESL